MDTRIETLLLEAGGRIKTLSPEETERQYVRWLDAYSRPVKAQTGDWIRDNYLWHAFSWEHAPGVSGDEALSFYAAERKLELVVLQEPDDEEIGAVVSGLAAPDLCNLELDIHVFPDSLQWTMAFTHEWPRLGPYYSRRDWVAKRDG